MAVMQPQWSTHTSIEFINYASAEHPALKSMSLLGWVFVTSNNNDSEELEQVKRKFPISVKLLLSGGSCSLSAQISNELDTTESLVNVVLQTDQQGFFLVPEDGVWNFGVNQQQSSNGIRAGWKVDDPLAFYDERQRASHFLSFVQLVAYSDEKGNVKELNDEMETLELVD